MYCTIIVLYIMRVYFIHGCDIMNNYDYYVPIDVKCPIRTTTKINVQKHTDNNPAIMFQLFERHKPLMLDDISKVAIAFTNTENKVTKGAGKLQVVNPHRGTISYELSSDDITMFGLHTVTLGITTNDSFFTVQCVIMCQEISDDLYNALTGKTSSNCSCGCSDKNCKCGCNNFPCKYYNDYCRLCRRCKWVWYHNTLPRPLCFEEIKMCKNPFIFPPVKNFAKMEGYENAHIPTTINEDGHIVAEIDGTEYVCDIGKDGSVYLADKSQTTPESLIGLYLGPKLTMYYKTSEKVNNEFDINSLFD